MSCDPSHSAAMKPLRFCSQRTPRACHFDRGRPDRRDGIESRSAARDPQRKGLQGHPRPDCSRPLDLKSGGACTTLAPSADSDKRRPGLLGFGVAMIREIGDQKPGLQQVFAGQCGAGSRAHFVPCSKRISAAASASGSPSSTTTSPASKRVSGAGSPTRMPRRRTRVTAAPRTVRSSSASVLPTA